MINWDSKQKRYVDPISSKDLNLDLNTINKAITSLLDIETGVIKGLNLSIYSNKEIKIEKGIFLCDNVFIHIIDDIILNINDIHLFSNNKFKPITSYGTYAVIATYKYSRNIKEIPIAKMFFIKDNENYILKNYEFSLGNFIVDLNLNIIGISEKNPIKEILNRQVVTLSGNIINETFTNLTIVDGGLL